MASQLYLKMWMMRRAAVLAAAGCMHLKAILVYLPDFAHRPLKI